MCATFLGMKVMSSTRRIFLARTAGFCAGLTFYRELLAAQPHLAESDPAAQALVTKELSLRDL